MISASSAPPRLCVDACSVTSVRSVGSLPEPSPAALVGPSVDGNAHEGIEPLPSRIDALAPRPLDSDRPPTARGFDHVALRPLAGKRQSSLSVSEHDPRALIDLQYPRGVLAGGAEVDASQLRLFPRHRKRLIDASLVR